MSYQRSNKGGRVAKSPFLAKSVQKSLNTISNIYNIYKIGLENFEMHEGNYRVDFFFGLIRTVPRSSGHWPKKRFKFLIDLGQIKKSGFGPY